MRISDLERNLSIAKARYEQAVQALAPKHQGGEWQEYESSYEALLFAERELCAAKGEEYAVPLEFPIKWSIGAPLPHLIASGRRVFLTFYISTPDPDWDGTYINVKDPQSNEIESLALVEFNRPTSVKLGSPNDEVFEGHRLAGRGLEAYTAQIVRNSRWVSEIESINSVHSQYNPEVWLNKKHYIFWFHDDTFECIAESYTVEIHKCTMSELLDKVMK